MPDEERGSVVQRMAAEPVAAAAAPGVLEGHILTLRDALSAANAAAAEARRLAAQRAEALLALGRRVDAAEAARDTAREAAALAEQDRDATRGALAVALDAARHARAGHLALANRRSWEIVAHAARLDEALAATRAARTALAAATARFQVAARALVAVTEAEAAALRGEVKAAETTRDTLQRELAHWRHGGRLARALRALRSGVGQGGLREDTRAPDA